MKPKIGLALGGGGARGFAHIGVLQVLEEARVPIYCIAGTSMGAIIGAMYAQNPDAKALEKKVVEFLEGKEFERLRLYFLREFSIRGDQRLNFFQRLAKFLEKELMLNAILLRQSLLSGQKAMNVLNSLLGGDDLKHTRIRFAAVASDLASGKEVVLEKGPLAKAVLASSSIVGVLPPVGWEDKILIDGGVLAMVPVSAAKRMGAQIVIAVDVGMDICRPPVIGDGLEEMLRTMEVMCYSLKQAGLEGADIIIRPHVSDVHWTEFSRVQECIRAGKEATQQQIKEINMVMRYGNMYRTVSKIRGFLVSKKRSSRGIGESP